MVTGPCWYCGTARPLVVASLGGLQATLSCGWKWLAVFSSGAARPGLATALWLASHHLVISVTVQMLAWWWRPSVSVPRAMLSL